MSLRKFALLAALGLAFVSGRVQAAVLLNEIYANPPGGDQGVEFFELLSTTGGAESFDGMWLVIIESNASETGAGVNGQIDQALNLSGLSTGSNGLFMWRDGSGVLSPAPAPQTSINIADFSPDIENGSNTYLLVTNFTGTVGDDLDLDGDGVLETTPWGSIIDGIALLESEDLNDTLYASQFGLPAFGEVGFTADVLFRDANNRSWVAADVLGASPGPFEFDPVEMALVDGTALTESDFVGNGTLLGVTPGSTNPALPLIAAPGLVGDYNGDSVVDAADYTIWRDNLGLDAAALGTGRNPAVTDALVVAADYDAWRNAFGNISSGGLQSGSTVPEPGTLTLVALSVVGLSLARRCRIAS